MANIDYNQTIQLFIWSSSMQAATWRMQDYDAGLCTLDQMGKPKTDDIQEVCAVIPPAHLGDLKQAAIAVARDKYGSYEEFFKAHPTFHEKFLLGMSREAVPSTPPDNKVRDIPWLSRTRLAYKDPARLADIRAAEGQVEDAKIIEPKA